MEPGPRSSPTVTIHAARTRPACERCSTAALGKAKLPAFHLYDLRHTFASLFVAASTSTTYVSVQLGYMNPSTTLHHFARGIPNKGRRWGGLLDRVREAVAADAAAGSAPYGGTH